MDSGAEDGARVEPVNIGWFRVEPDDWKHLDNQRADVENIRLICPRCYEFVHIPLGEDHDLETLYVTAAQHVAEEHSE